MKKMAGMITVLIALVCRPLYAQTVIERQTSGAYSKNCIYLELLGTGLLYSVNYEHRFAEHWSGRVGFTRFSIPTIFEPELDLSVTGFPVLMNYLAGNNGHYFEMGAGAMVFKLNITGRELWLGMDVNGHATEVIGAMSIGYRYQPAKGGFLFRIGVTPLIHPGGMKISGGLSLGAAF